MRHKKCDRIYKLYLWHDERSEFNIFSIIMTAIMLKAQPRTYTDVVLAARSMLLCVIYLAQSQRNHLRGKKQKNGSWQFCCLVRRFLLDCRYRKKVPYHNSFTFHPLGYWFLISSTTGGLLAYECRTASDNSNAFELFPHSKFPTYKATFFPRWKTQVKVWPGVIEDKRRRKNGKWFMLLLRSLQVKSIKESWWDKAL